MSGSMWPHGSLVTINPIVSPMTPTSGPLVKRCKRSTVLIEDDLDAAEAITHENITKRTRLSAVQTKTVLVPLVQVTENQDGVLRGMVHLDNDFYFGDDYQNESDYQQNYPVHKASKIEYFLT